MSKIHEEPEWEAEIYKLTTETPVLGFDEKDGSDGHSNIQAKQLANRTLYLKGRSDLIDDRLLTATGDYTSATEAQSAINNGTEKRQFFNVMMFDNNWVERYENINGVATPTGVRLPNSKAVDAINELINRDGTTSSLVLMADVNGVNVGAFAPDGGLYLCGLFGALQDQWPIQNPSLVQSSVAFTSSIYPIIGANRGSDNLHELSDADKNPAIIIRKDGGVWLYGLLGALQDQYAIKHGGAVQNAVAQISELTDLVKAFRSVPTDRAFYALDKSGNLQTQGIAINRLTRATDTGFKLNSWPQGKMKLDSKGRIYVGYNSSNGHGGSTAIPVIKWSDDNGRTWSRPVYLVANEGKARGTDWWALGVDSEDVLWGIIRSRGATNAVGETEHNIYKSIDRGLSWIKVGPLTVTQNTEGVDYVPELYHDMAFINGSMITGYHFAGSSRVGFLKFSVSDPLGSIINVDVIADGEYSKLVYCEPTIAVDFEKSVDGHIYGGLRTQTTTNPSKLYYMNADLTGFTMFDSPDSVQYSPMAIRRSNGQFVLLTIERFNTGVMNLWFCNPGDFYSGATGNFWKMQIGRIIKDRITGASNVGVQAMESNGEYIYMAWSNETDNTYSDTFFGVMNIVRPTSFIGYEYLERM